MSKIKDAIIEQSALAHLLGNTPEKQLQWRTLDDIERSMSRAKEEQGYLSNETIAEAIITGLSEDDARNVAEWIIRKTND